jgi:transitional endoplasmic reticulum ATPase
MDAELELKVAEALAEDVGKGLVRLDPEDIRTLSAVLGDVVEINGEKKTVARITGTFPEYHGKKMIQMDGITRGNSKSNLGGTVKIKRISRKTAMTVIVLPLDFWRSFPSGEMDQFAKVFKG